LYKKATALEQQILKLYLQIQRTALITIMSVNSQLYMLKAIPLNKDYQSHTEWKSHATRMLRFIRTLEKLFSKHKKKNHRRLYRYPAAVSEAELAMTNEVENQNELNM